MSRRVQRSFVSSLFFGKTQTFLCFFAVAACIAACKNGSDSAFYSQYCSYMSPSYLRSLLQCESWQQQFLSILDCRLDVSARYHGGAQGTFSSTLFWTIQVLFGMTFMAIVQIVLVLLQLWLLCYRV